VTVWIKEMENSIDLMGILQKINQENIIFLDSSKEDKELSKYSFLGFNPFLVFKFDGEESEINERGVKRYVKGDPLELLRKLLQEYKFETDSDLPLVSGALGYISYDYGKRMQGMPLLNEGYMKIPEIYFVFYDNMLIKDIEKDKVYLTSRDGRFDIPQGNAKTSEFKGGSNSFNSNFTKEEYMDAVREIKDYIREGHVYIANMTQRFRCRCSGDSIDIYRELRKSNGAPFSAYMNLEGFTVLSSSPERFLKLSDGKAETKPIKGTRPRGKDIQEDRKNRNELTNSDKDKAELLMIVDLERNDLSKVCKPHSVKVKELFKIEEYATVFHLVSSIEGELKPEEDVISLIRATFPGGSITGAPKLRAMEIISELEASERGLYTGSIGYIDFRGNADFNIVIRTILTNDNEAFFGVGGGITYDSVEELEYQETLDKAKALMEVLEWNG